MKANKIQITLEHSNAVGNSYRIAKLKGALSISVHHERKSVEIRVGESMTEAQAQEVVSYHHVEVTVIPAT